MLLPSLLGLSAGSSWPRFRSLTREERIAHAERKELVRSALRSAAMHGYFIFDELMTEEVGVIDFLAVGPVGGCVIVVRDEEGAVTADADGTLFLNGRLFADDPRRQAEDLTADVNAKLKDTGAYAYHIICFTRAEIYYLGKDQNVLEGICPTWDLALPFASAEAEHNPADVADIASVVRQAYRRLPFVIPEEAGTQ